MKLAAAVLENPEVYPTGTHQGDGVNAVTPARLLSKSAQFFPIDSEHSEKPSFTLAEPGIGAASALTHIKLYDWKG
jgi:hypothetical protein